MTSLLVIQNDGKSVLCLKRAWNLLLNGTCKKKQCVVGQETQGTRHRNWIYICNSYYSIILHCKSGATAWKNKNYVHKPCYYTSLK